ncbi:hypothetical protein H0E87_000413 [Populus deltoides]|uniref:Uncharacterized protein n=1 Tax=Populus deltoides TaxID=3696 RepID=A0A8T2ZMJ7_POPDE|nr:hypothetical protein H0E87_000413 [Populus deltoides]
MGLIYTGEDEGRERDKYGRPCLSVWVNGVHFMLVTVKSTTRDPSIGRPYPSGTPPLWRGREILVVSSVHEPSLKDSGEGSLYIRIDTTFQFLNANLNSPLRVLDS